MAVPKKKTSRSKMNKRRNSSFKLFQTNTGKCNNCGAIKMPHHVCQSCGYYNNKKIISFKVSQEA